MIFFVHVYGHIRGHQPYHIYGETQTRLFDVIVFWQKLLLKDMWSSFIMKNRNPKHIKYGTTTMVHKQSTWNCLTVLLALYQIYIYIKLGNGDYVPRKDKFAKFGWDRISGSEISGSRAFYYYFLFFFFLSHAYSLNPWTDSHAR